jgi:uncharacterized protein with FMN-binding domain
MKENMFFSKGIALALVFAVLAALMFGCTQPGPQGSPSGNGSKIDKTGNMTIGDNKTGFDKTQETIELAVADGTYAADATYAQPKGNATAKISITVKDDIITAASAEGVNADPWSTKIIGDFNAALPDLVVGKKITELDIPINVAGSSLTTAAFKSYVGELVESKGQQS